MEQVKFTKPLEQSTISRDSERKQRKINLFSNPLSPSRATKIYKSHDPYILNVWLKTGNNNFKIKKEKPSATYGRQMTAGFEERGRRGAKDLKKILKRQ